MTRFKIFFMEYKKGLLMLGIVLASMVLFELFVFNKDFFIDKVNNLEERRYSINDASLHQFTLENGNLVSQGSDPNITFHNIDLSVDTILIKCTSSVSGLQGQVFYRGEGDEFSESRSIKYPETLNDPILLLDQSFGIPRPVIVSSLRFDLTEVSGDVLVCSDFVVNPHVPFTFDPVRLLIYFGILLVLLFYIFRNVQFLTFFREKYKQEHKKNILLLSIAFVSMVLFELVVFNQAFLINQVSNLEEKRYSINEGILHQFTMESGKLVAQGVDPNITFHDINLPVHTILIECVNSAPGVQGQVFYRSESDEFSESRSIKYLETLNNPVLWLNQNWGIPQPVSVSSLRFDLTEMQGDVLVCGDFVINPQMPFTLNPFRLIIYSGIFLVLFVYFFRNVQLPFFFQIKQIVVNSKKKTVLKKFFTLFEKNITIYCILSLIIIYIDFLYPPIFTYDSSYYFWYVDILNGNTPFSAWDPIRGITFPLILKITTDIFGQNLLSIMILLSTFHVLFFITSSSLLIRVFKPITSNYAARWIIFFVFIFVAMDSLVIGFYHAVLTEFLASYLAILASFLGFLLIKNLNRNRTMVLIFISFTIIIPVAWQLKQPYVGVGLFPLLLSSAVILLDKSYAWGTKGWIIIGNLCVLLGLVVSSVAWNQFILTETNHKGLGSYADKVYASSIQLIQKSPTAFAKKFINNYLAISNIYFYDYEASEQQNAIYTHDIVIRKDFSLNRGMENKAIGYRIYNIYGTHNFLISSGIQAKYLNYITPYKISYYSPLPLNSLLSSWSAKSNVVFSLSYLLLPFAFLMQSFLLLLNKRSDKLIVSFILCGSSLFNAVAHSFMYNPIDRYIFWGYPLLLVSILVMFIGSVRWSKNVAPVSDIPV